MPRARGQPLAPAESGAAVGAAGTRGRGRVYEVLWPGSERAAFRAPAGSARRGIWEGAGGSGASCVIGGTTYADGAANPANACQTCQISFAATSWTTAANGASCGTGQVCSSGTSPDRLLDRRRADRGSGATNSDVTSAPDLQAGLQHPRPPVQQQRRHRSCGNGQIWRFLVAVRPRATWAGRLSRDGQCLNPANSCQ